MRSVHPDLETVDYWEIMETQIWKAAHPGLLGHKITVTPAKQKNYTSFE
jgi:hypothetical protein